MRVPTPLLALRAAPPPLLLAVALQAAAAHIPAAAPGHEARQRRRAPAPVTPALAGAARGGGVMQVRSEVIEYGGLPAAPWLAQIGDGVAAIKALLQQLLQMAAYDDRGRGARGVGGAP